ncbi:MAG: hypothetical protein ACI83O_000286 [Patescibacteria group bacterium]|jgi:uncharacterized protein (TIGR00730 family)
MVTKKKDFIKPAKNAEYQPNVKVVKKMIKNSKNKKELTPILDELKNNHFRISIFGSARTKRGDPEYKLAYTLGYELGRRQLDVVTGGGPGQMEAANRGHKEGRGLNSKAHSIGLAIKLKTEQKENASLDVMKKFQTFSKRLDQFMLLSNAVIITPGGIGTVLELFYTWQLVQTNKICNIPIILVGKQWRTLAKWMKDVVLKEEFINPQDMEMIYVANDYKQALKIIEETYKEYIESDGKFCLNYNKYKI